MEQGGAKEVNKLSVTAHLVNEVLTRDRDTSSFR